VKMASVFSEAWRNLVSGTSRALWFALALAIFGGGLGIADVATTGALISQANDYKASGAAITTLVAQGRIDGRKCALLSDIPGVTASGAMRSANNVKLLALPASPVPTKEVTAGFPQLLGFSLNTASPGIFISQEVAEDFDITPATIQPGTKIDTDQGPAAVAGVFDYPADGRRPGLGYALLVPATSDAAFDECWIASWPQSAEVRTLIRLSLTPDEAGSTNEQPLVTQLNSRNGASFDGSLRFEERITRLGGPASLLGGAILGYLFVRVRRLEFAAARHSGITFIDQATQIGVECSLVAVTAWTLCNPAITYATAVSTGPVSPAMLVIGLKPLLVTTIAFVSGACIGSACVREKHLFKYFKNR